MPRLILASASPYRRELLERLGVPFEVRPATAVESALPGEDAPTLAARLATAKARSVEVLDHAADAIILGADQVAALNGELLRKPGDHRTALRQLSACQGETVVFSTATTVIDCSSGRQGHGLVSTAVVFLKLS